MARSRSWRRRRPTGSRQRLESSLPARIPSRTITVPDSNGSLSEGVVVEANVWARVLGLKVLRVRADILLVPARLKPPDARSRSTSPVVPRPEQTSALNASGRAAGRASSVRALNDGAGALAEAIRLIDESEHTLDRVRTDAQFRPTH